MTWFDDMQFRNAVRTAAWLLVALLAVTLVYMLSSVRYVGAGITPGNTISISGYGEAVAVPDIATFSFSVVSEKQTVAAAQADVIGDFQHGFDKVRLSAIDASIGVASAPLMAASARRRGRTTLIMPYASHIVF